MVSANHPPSIRETAFDCPHCGAYTTQYWLTLYSNYTEDNQPPAFFSFDEKGRSGILIDPQVPETTRTRLNEYWHRMDSKLVFLESSDISIRHDVNNLFLSKCYNCKKITVWVHDYPVFPDFEKSGEDPNQDLAEEIIGDYEEARAVINESPRAAAALLRLCIQKLCKQLGESGKNINQDIGNLVKKGLNPLVQQSLDIVRVIGNEAVHPGVMDLIDNRDTALRLLELVNSIAEQMISHPNKVGDLYNQLPKDKRAEIEKRDNKE